MKQKAFEVTIDEFTRYRAGITTTEEDPSIRRYKNMLHLVAYDISSPKRLAKVAKTCEDYGIRVEYSVFECDLAPDDFMECWERLNDLVDPEEDALLAYRICGECVQKIESSGIVKRPGKVLFYMP